MGDSGASFTLKVIAPMLTTMPHSLQFQEILNAAAGTQAQPRSPISSAFEPHMSVFVDAQDK